MLGAMLHDLRKRLRLGDCVCERPVATATPNELLFNDIKCEKIDDKSIAKCDKIEVKSFDIKIEDFVVAAERMSAFPRECDSDCNDCSDCQSKKPRARVVKRSKIGRRMTNRRLSVRVTTGPKIIRRSSVIGITTDELSSQTASKRGKSKKIKDLNEEDEVVKIIRTHDKRRRTLGSDVIEQAPNQRIGTNKNISQTENTTARMSSSTVASQAAPKSAQSNGLLSALKRLEGREGTSRKIFRNSESVAQTYSVDSVFEKSHSVLGTQKSTDVTDIIKREVGEVVSLQRTDLSRHCTERSSTRKLTSNLEMTSGLSRCVIKRYRIEQTCVQYPLTPHEWLDCGRLLLLTDPRSEHNMPLFRHQWRSAAPILVSNCNRYLDTSLWTPDAFSEEFGHLSNDLVDCAHKGVVLPQQPMNKFWAGFECIKNRMTDKQVQIFKPA